MIGVYAGAEGAGTRPSLDDDRSWDPRPRRQGWHVGLVAGAGLLVGLALYPLAVLLAQVFARSCRDGDLGTLVQCLWGGLTSLVVAGILLTAAASVALWRARTPFGTGVAVLSLLTAVALAWRLLYVFDELVEVLGRKWLWIGAPAFTLLYVGWFLLLTVGRGRFRGIAEVAGVGLLALPFLAPASIDGAAHREYVAHELAWYESLPFTVYEPTTAPPGFSVRTAEGRFSSPPELKIRLAGSNTSFEVIESQPYPAFAPPESCGLGFPSDFVRPDPSCRAVASMPSGEPIWYSFSQTSNQGIYATQLSSTVITVVEPLRPGMNQTPDMAFVEMLQSLRPVDAVEFGERILARRS